MQYYWRHREVAPCTYKRNLGLCSLPRGHFVESVERRLKTTVEVIGSNWNKWQGKVNRGMNVQSSEWGCRVTSERKVAYISNSQVFELWGNKAMGLEVKFCFATADPVFTMVFPTLVLWAVWICRCRHRCDVHFQVCSVGCGHPVQDCCFVSHRWADARQSP